MGSTLLKSSASGNARGEKKASRDRHFVGSIFQNRSESNQATKATMTIKTIQKRSSEVVLANIRYVLP